MADLQKFALDFSCVAISKESLELDTWNSNSKIHRKINTYSIMSERLCVGQQTLLHGAVKVSKLLFTNLAVIIYNIC
jgi:hypothetical protein